MNPSPEAIEIAARALHEGTLLPFLHIQNGSTSGYSTWENLGEGGRRSTITKVRKALEAPTFDDYYAWLTLPERLAGSGFVAVHGQPPAADADTERTRGHRAEYYLIQHLLRIDDAALLTGSTV